MVTSTHICTCRRTSRGSGSYVPVFFSDQPIRQGDLLSQLTGPAPPQPPSRCRWEGLLCSGGAEVVAAASHCSKALLTALTPPPGASGGARAVSSPPSPPHQGPAVGPGRLGGLGGLGERRWASPTPEAMTHRLQGFHRCYQTHPSHG